MPPEPDRPGSTPLNCIPRSRLTPHGQAARVGLARCAGSQVNSKEIPRAPGLMRSWIIKPRAVRRRRQLEWMGKAVERRSANLAESTPLVRAPAEVACALWGGPLEGLLRSWCRGHVVTLSPRTANRLAWPPRRGDSALRSRRGQPVRTIRQAGPCGCYQCSSRHKFTLPTPEC
jgi:hypothetical protein